MFGAPLSTTQPKPLQTSWVVWGVSCEKNSIFPFLCLAAWVGSAVNAVAQVISLALLSLQPSWAVPFTIWRLAKTQGLDLFFPRSSVCGSRRCFADRWLIHWAKWKLLLCWGAAPPPPVPFGTQLSLQRTAPSFAGAKLAPEEQPWHATEGKSLCLSLASRSVPAVDICGVGGWVRSTCLEVKPGLYFPSALDHPCSERSPKDGPLRSNRAALYLQVMLVPITGTWAGADPYNSLHCWDAPCLAVDI